MGAASRRAETSLESRGILISTAATLFAEKGFRNTTFIDIAERSGISRGSIPWHFGNKDGLLKAVVDEFTAGALFDDAPPAGIEAGIALALGFLRQPTTRLLITLVAEAVEPDSPVHTFYAELHRSMRKWTAAWVGTLTIPPGVSRDDYAAIILGAIIGVHQQWQIAHDEIDLDRTLAALAAILLSFQPR
jgi:TetR/AcrR family transcriptional regulator, acrAB operon repressor